MRLCETIFKHFDVCRCSCCSRSTTSSFGFVEIVASLLSNKRLKRFHNCSLTRQERLPQRPAQRRITSRALFREASHIDFVHEKRHMFVWGWGVCSCDVSL